MHIEMCVCIDGGIIIVCDNKMQMYVYFSLPAYLHSFSIVTYELFCLSVCSCYNTGTIHESNTDSYYSCHWIRLKNVEAVIL